MKDGFNEDGFYDAKTWEITLPKRVYRQSSAYLFLALLPCAPLVMQGIYQLLLGKTLRGVVVLTLASYIACIGWMLYSSVMSRKKFRYLSRQYIGRLLADNAFRNEEREKAKSAASVRHEGNRNRKAKARAVYEGKGWPSKAAAARALASQFHVTPKTVEKWISSWHKD